MHTLPAGKYFIGDPFLALPEDTWNAFVDQFSGEQEQLVEIGEHEIWIASTGMSDVNFTLQGSEYENVSGFYGVLPIELLTEIEESELQDYGVVVEFKRVFNCSTDGTHVDVGKYTIKPAVDVDDFDDDDEYGELSF